MSNNNHATGHMTVRWEPDGHGDTDVITTMDLQDDDQMWEGFTAMIASRLAGTGLSEDEAIVFAYRGLCLARSNIELNLGGAI